jgi:hypothetical protein
MDSKGVATTGRSRFRPRCYQDGGGLTLEQALTVHAAEQDFTSASERSTLAEYSRLVALKISRRGNRHPITPALQCELAKQTLPA